MRRLTGENIYDIRSVARQEEHLRYVDGVWIRFMETQGIPFVHSLFDPLDEASLMDQ